MQVSSIAMCIWRIGKVTIYLYREDMHGNNSFLSCRDKQGGAATYLYRKDKQGIAAICTVRICKVAASVPRGSAKWQLICTARISKVATCQ
jgi:hypothetical protein